MLGKMQRPQRGARRGQGLVELALVLPILVTLLIGLTDAGRWLDASHRLTRAAGEGARFGSVKDAAGTAYPSADEIRSHILEALPPGLRNANVEVNATATVSDQPAVSVRLSYAFPCFTPGFGNGVLLTAQSWFPRR